MYLKSYLKLHLNLLKKGNFLKRFRYNARYNSRYNLKVQKICFATAPQSTASSGLLPSKPIAAAKIPSDTLVIIIRNNNTMVAVGNRSVYVVRDNIFQAVTGSRKSHE